MMSKWELENWRRTCLSKKPFTTRQKADKHAKRGSNHFGTPTRVYACPYCSNWHLTTQAPREAAPRTVV